jgi:hypothetical protein
MRCRRGIDSGMAQPQLTALPVLRIALRAVLAAALLSAAPALAGETALLRIGEHDGMLRIVIETGKRLDSAPSLSPTGRRLSISLPGSEHLVTPRATPAAVTAIRQRLHHNHRRATLLIEFRGAMALSHNMLLPSIQRPGFRLVLDFRARIQPEPHRPTTSVTPPPPAPPPDVLLRQAGFVPMRFGMNDTDLLAQLADLAAASPSPVRMTIDAGTTSARPLIRTGWQAPRFGRCHTVYEFTAASHRLSAISAEWGKDATDPLDDDALQDLFIEMSAGLIADGFKPTGPALGAPLADHGRIGFSGLDASGRLATLSIHALAVAGDADAASPGLFLRLTMTDPAIID